MATSLADAYVRIRADTSGLTNDAISKPAASMGKAAGEEAGKAFGLSFSSLLKGAAVAAAGVAGSEIVGFFKETISEASDVNEAASKVNVVFGKSTQAVLEFGKNSATSMGLSKSAYLDATGTLGNLFVALKLPGPQAEQMSTSMVKLAGDLASFNNTSPEDALNALRSGLVGETEPLRAYGVNINQATLQTEAMKLGLISNIKDALTPAQKAQATYALVLDQTKTAQGDFARTSGGLANQQRILTAQFDDLKGTIGAALLPTIVSLVNFITGKAVPGIQAFIAGLKGDGSSSVDGFVGDMARAGSAVRGLVDSLKTNIVPILVGLAKAFNDNRAPIVAFVAVLGTAQLVIRGVAAATAAWAAIQATIAFIQLAAGVRSFADAWALLDAAMDANPIGIVVIAIAALVAGVVLAYNKVGWFRDGVNAAWDAIKTASLFLWHNVFEPMWQGIVAGVQAVIPIFQAWYSGLKLEFDLAQTAVLFLWHQVFEPMWHGIETAFQGIVAAAKVWWAGMQIEFDLAKAAINVVGTVVMWLWHTIFEPAFNAISIVVKDWWIVVENIFKLVVAFIQITMGPIIKGLQTTFQLVFDAIRVLITSWWNVVKAIFDGVVAYVKDVLAPVYTWLWHNVVEPAFNGIRDLISTVWNNGIKPVFEALGGFITNTVAPAFRTGVNAIGQAWTQIEALAKAPVNFVINTVINHGIIDSLNTVTGWLGHNAGLGHLSPLATGGVIPGNVRNDGILGLSAGGMPTARVESGEFVVNRRQTSRNLGLLHAINAGVPGFALGGLVDAITNPLSFLTNAAGIGDITRNFAGPFAGSLIGMPEKVISAAVDWLKEKISAITNAGISGNLGSWITTAMAIAGVPAGWFAGLVTLINRESGGNPRAINLTDANAAAGHPSMGLMQTIIGTFEAYRNPALPDDVYNPIANIVAGINYILARYGDISNVQQANPNMPPMGYANGGVISEPIWGVGRSGRRYTFGERGPETVTPGVGAGAGVNLTIHVHGDVGDAQVRAIKTHVDDAFRNLLTQMRTGRRR